MDRKHGIINLGRSKSPKHLKDQILSENSSRYRVPSSATSREKEPLQQTSVLNQSMQLPAQQNSVKQLPVNFAQTHPGFFPPSPQSIFQRVVIKQNVVSPNRTNVVKQSPSRKIVVVESSPRKVVQKVPEQVEKQGQLLRKIKVLQTRIQQLHQQKQTCVVKAHQQNKRLILDNTLLQRRLAQIQGIKNKQIACLLQQNSHLKNIIHSAPQSLQISPQPQIKLQSQYQEPADKSHKQLKNLAYIDDEEDKISIKNHGYANEEPVSRPPSQDHQTEADIKTEKRHLTSKIQDLQSEKNSLKQQLQEMKAAFINTSAIIQENNQKITESYQEKINMLLQQLESYKKLPIEGVDVRSLQKALEFSQKQTQDYVARLLVKSKELMKKQDECSDLKKQLEFSRKQTEDYVARLLVKSKDAMKKQEECQNLKKDLAFSRKQIQQYVQRVLSKSQQCMNQEKSFLARIKQLEQQLQQSSALTSRTQQSKPGPHQSCQKCKQLMKTLIKLNQKTFSKTS